MPVFSAELQLNLIYIQRLAKLTSKSIFCDKIFQLLYSPIGVLLNNADSKQILVGPDQKNSVLNRHSFDADPDPYQTFHFDADPDLDLDPTPNLTHVEKS
jgi:hypothetical protein